MKEDCSEENRVAGYMKLKMHNKINPNSHRRGEGEEERKRKIEKEQMKEKRIVPMILKH